MTDRLTPETLDELERLITADQKGESWAIHNLQQLLRNYASALLATARRERELDAMRLDIENLEEETKHITNDNLNVPLFRDRLRAILRRQG